MLGEGIARRSDAARLLAARKRARLDPVVRHAMTAPYQIQFRQPLQTDGMVHSLSGAPAFESRTAPGAHCVEAHRSEPKALVYLPVARDGPMAVAIDRLSGVADLVVKPTPYLLTCSGFLKRIRSWRGVFLDLRSSVRLHAADMEIMTPFFERPIVAPDDPGNIRQWGA